MTIIVTIKADGEPAHVSGGNFTGVIVAADTSEDFEVPNGSALTVRDLNAEVASDPELPMTGTPKPPE